MEREVKLGLLLGLPTTSVGAACVVLALTDTWGLGELTGWFRGSAIVLCGVGLIFTIGAIVRHVSARTSEPH